MGRRTVLLIVAVLVAAAGTALILMYVQGINARAVEGQDRVQVLAATAAISPGESMDDAQAAGKIDAVEVARDSQVDGALSSTEGLEGQVALAPIYPGEQIIAQKFGKPGDQESLSIPDDKLAISVELSDPARVAGFIMPGSSVAIFVSADPTIVQPDGTQRTLAPVTRLLLPKVQVVGVGTTTVQSKTTTTAEGEQTTEQIPRTILTLAVTQEEAEKIIFATREGELALGLLSARSSVTDTAGTTATDIFPEVAQ